MDGIERHLSAKIARLMQSFPAVVITGARQTGKSTLANMMRPEWQYFDLENPNTQARIADDPVLFFRENPGSIILDEAHRVPKIFETLRGIIDEDRSANGRFIITGSASLDLLKAISESLAGRVAIVQLSPLKLTERMQKPLSNFYGLFESVIEHQAIEALLDLPNQTDQIAIKEHLFSGGYPQPCLSSNIDFHLDWMENYFNTYINRDMRALFPNLDSLRYRRVVQMLSQLSGTIVNRSEIARSIEGSEKRVRDYLEIIEGTFFWRSLPGFLNPNIKTSTKLPKGHFTDTGLCLFLNNVHQIDQLEAFPRLGNLFESFVVEEVIRGIECTRARNTQISHYRTKAGAEIDLIIEGSFGMLPIEIKHQSNTRKKNVIALDAFVQKQQLPLGLVINRCDRPSLITERILQLPVSCI